MPENNCIWRKFFELKKSNLSRQGIFGKFLNNLKVVKVGKSKRQSLLTAIRTGTGNKLLGL